MEHAIYELNTNTVLVNNSLISLKKSPVEDAGSSASQEITSFFLMEPEVSFPDQKGSHWSVS